VAAGLAEGTASAQAMAELVARKGLPKAGI
jgi:hypothetical protein